mgnify:CR=1 FL=1
MSIQNSLILLRGLPGAGKSTLAHVLSENNTYPIFSVDDFFTDEVTGEYVFNFSDNHLAYKQCEELSREKPALPDCCFTNLICRKRKNSRAFY